MLEFLTLKIEWPDLSKDDLVRATGGIGAVSECESQLHWNLPLPGQTEVRPITVRRSDSPLASSRDAICVRNLADLRHLATMSPDGGLYRLLHESDVSTVLDELDAQLRPLGDRLRTGTGVYIFGAHRNAVKCVRYCNELGIKIAGLVDNDQSKQGQDFLGFKVFPLAEVPREASIINASGRYCVEINEQLQQSGYRWSIDFMQFLFLYDLHFQAQAGFRKYVADLIDDRFSVLSLYLMLADDYSRVVLDGLVLFRLSLDSAVAGRITSPYTEEFFAPDIQSFGDREVFVDGGAYDGDSYLRFARVAPDYTKAYLFEPDQEICARAKQRIDGDVRVSVCNSGLWSETCELRFSTTGDMDGAISDDGDVRVKVVAIDEFIKEPVTHIKLDVEGAEAEALMGAKRQIGNARPKMAVALYHRASDLWKIPALIETLGGQYSFGIRHYSQTIDDSIVYAYPVT